MRLLPGVHRVCLAVLLVGCASGANSGYSSLSIAQQTVDTPHVEIELERASSLNTHIVATMVSSSTAAFDIGAYGVLQRREDGAWVDRYIVPGGRRSSPGRGCAIEDECPVLASDQVLLPGNVAEWYSIIPKLSAGEYRLVVGDTRVTSPVLLVG